LVVTRDEDDKKVQLDQLTNLEAKLSSGTGPLRVALATHTVMARGPKLLSWAAFLLLSASAVIGYEIPIFDTEYSKQICSGMWGGRNTFINGTCPGPLAVVIFYALFNSL
jgi:hypothetical protein